MPIRIRQLLLASFCTWYVFFHLILTKCYEIGFINLPILQVRKRGLCEVNELAQDDTGSKQ